MVVGILNFIEPSLALNYLICCIISSLGAIQFAAAHARLVGLMILPPSHTRWLGAGLVAFAFCWFFAVEPDLFIPGLAGGEFFVLFFLGFCIALLLALALGIAATTWRAARSRPPRSRESVVLPGGGRAELWLPESKPLELILALRETPGDSLDLLCRQLVDSGAAVLFCSFRDAEQAHVWATEKTARFASLLHYVMGLGPGADRGMGLASSHPCYVAALALAPFGRAENARPGLRWLRETDYFTAARLTWRKSKIPAAAPSASDRVIFGDEDLLVRPAAARELYPGALLVAGARHMTLAASPAVLTLALDLFGLRLHPSVAGVDLSAAKEEAGE